MPNYSVPPTIIYIHPRVLITTFLCYTTPMHRKCNILTRKGDQSQLAIREHKIKRRKLAQNFSKALKLTDRLSFLFIS